MTKLSEIQKGFPWHKANYGRYLCETSKVKAVKGTKKEYYINDIKEVRRAISLINGKA